MKATEFIRGLLDLIDQAQDETKDVSQQDYELEVPKDEIEEPTELANSPDTMTVSKDVILSIGNDLNKPKHPSDLRTDSFSLYPNTQYDPRK